MLITSRMTNYLTLISGERTQSLSLRVLTLALLLTLILSGVATAQQKATTGYAPVGGLKMYYEMQGHGRTGDIKRDITYENLSDDVAELLGFLKIERADIVGYSLGGGVAIQCAIRHPEKVRKVVVISAPFRRDGWVKEANDFWPNFSLEMMKGTPAETEREKLNPVPNSFPDFFNHIKATALKPYDFGADKLKATKAPMFFINGDADGVRFDHIAEMYRLKGGGNIHGDMQPRSESRLAIIPNTTHVTLIARMSTIIPMINDFLDAKPQKQ